MAWTRLLVPPQAVGMTNLDGKIVINSEANLPPGSFNFLAQTQLSPVVNKQNLVLIGLTCVASVAGNLLFDSNIPEHALNLGLLAGPNVFRAENSPLWFFGDTTVLNLTTTTATLTNVQIITALIAR